MLFQNKKTLNIARIFILALLLLNFTFLFTKCSTVDPVLSDICQITDDICFYATSICDIYNSDSTKFNNIRAIYASLISDLDKLKQIKNELDPSINKTLKINRDDIKKELNLIRSNLKRLLPAE